MKKTLLSLLMFLALPLMAQVSNPSIIPVAGAPSGACSQNLPDQQTTVAGVLYTCQNGVWGAVSGGGGSLPTAATGQILSNTSGSTTYAGQANIFYQQSGDTIASIEAACSSACTYVVTSPQTITLAASHAMNANVWIKFEGDGVWTVNGTGFTLSGIQIVTSSTLSKHLVAGTGSIALGAYNTQVPIEWFGAVGDGAYNYSTSSGTDNTTFIQACLNDIYAGQCVGQAAAYKITSALSITRSLVGFGGAVGGYWPTTIFTTSTTADILDVYGTGTGGMIHGNTFTNFNVDRSVVPTGTTDNGISINYVGGYKIDNVASNNSHRQFYYHSAPSFGVGLTSNTQAGISNPAITTGSYQGYYLDSADGNAENSIRFLYDTAGNGTGNTSQTTYGMILTGSAVNDVITKGFETAGMTYGQVVNYTGGGGGFATNDIHFLSSIHDGVGISCYKISNTSLATDGFVEINGGHCNSSTSASALIDIESSYGVSVSGVDINQHNGFGASHALYAASSDHIIWANNTVTNFGTTNTSDSPLEWTGVTHSSATGNTVYAYSTNAGNIIWLTGNSTYNSVTGNNLSGYSTAGYGIGIDSGSNYNNCCAANSIDTTHITSSLPVSDSGTGNGFTKNVSVTGATATAAGTSEFLAIGGRNIDGWNNATPSQAWDIGWYIPNTTTGTGADPNFYVYSGSAWASGWSINHSTLAMTFAGAVTAPSYNTSGGRKGTFVCTNGGTITIANTNELVTSDVIISMNTAGGTITTPPAMKTVTSGTGFTVLCGATDTSTYNYDILN